MRRNALPGRLWADLACRRAVSPGYKSLSSLLALNRPYTFPGENKPPI